jgi:hypothetical protein
MSTAPGSLRFIQAHGTHPQPELALELVWAQLASQLGLVSGAVASTRMSPTQATCGRRSRRPAKMAGAPWASSSLM